VLVTTEKGKVMVQNSLTIYQKMNDPMAAVQFLGRSISGSGLFGCQNEFQGQVLALECLSTNTPPLTLQKEYHVMFNGITMKSDTMLAKFHQLGGKSKIIVRTSERAEIELEKENDTQRFSFTWEEAQREDFIYEGKPKELKPLFRAYIAGKGPQPEISNKYFSPRSRMQMLWARVVSDGVRAMMPEVNASRYTPEEAGEVDDVETSAGGDGGAIDAEYEIKETKTETPANGNGNGHASTPPVASEDGFASSGQARTIYGLFDDLNLKPEQRAAILAKRNVESARSLTVEQATELIAGLQKKLADVTAAAQSVDGGKSAEDPDAHSSTRNGPCSQVQIDKAKSLIQEVEQSFPGLSDKLKEKLLATGRIPAPGCKLLSVMTYAEMDSLIQSLMKKELEAFFAKSLQPAEKPVEQPTGGDAATEGDSKN
jgi:hypothetical protein